MNRHAKRIFREARRQGLSLHVVGDRVVAEPEDCVGFEFREQLRMYRFELFAEITRQQEALLHVSKQILLGEFSNADSATWQRLAQQIGGVE